MSKLETFLETDGLERNRLLFSWLSDDDQRAALYEELELRKEDFPVLRLKSLLRSRNDGKWTNQDVYVLWKREDVETALKYFSVEPYRALGSGGKFMLGMDDQNAHQKQNASAKDALNYKELKNCASQAFSRAAVLPLKGHKFDLPDLAEQTALRYVALLFGFRDEAHGILQRLMDGIYRRLSFQIIGRHFVSESDSELPALGSPAAVQAKTDLETEIRLVAEKAPMGEGARKQTIIGRLKNGGYGLEELYVVVPGLIAGTIGNVRAAVSIAIYDFFNRPDGSGRLIDKARDAARRGNDGLLTDLVMKALISNPPAAFLARGARTSDGQPVHFKNEKGDWEVIPQDAHILLAMGAEPNEKLIFGGPDQADYLHRCIGEHLARPLVVETVRQVLLLPGLGQVIDADSGEPKGLEKRWGVICEKYPLRYQRDRRLNQQPLYVVLKIKEPVQENARKLEVLMKAGAPQIEEALRDSRHVHFAWFMLVENNTHLAMSTAYDGDFDAYVAHFAVKVPLFDKQFDYLDYDLPRPIRDHPKEFVALIKERNRAPFGEYFYSAYPNVTVADIQNAMREPVAEVENAIRATDTDVESAPREPVEYKEVENAPREPAESAMGETP